MTSKSMEFWYEFASPYAYMAAMRIERLAAEAGIEVTWIPFVIGPILRLRPGNASPFQDAPPAQKAYRQRDVERQCAREGIALRWPSDYPRNGMLAARIAQVAEPDWRPAFTRAVYCANFAEDRPIAEAEVMADILRQLGRDPQAVLAAATAPDNKARLAARVEEAISRGIFGAPSFVVGGELFWGNDRLEQAIAWGRAPWL